MPTAAPPPTTTPRTSTTLDTSSLLADEDAEVEKLFVLEPRWRETQKK
jgi:hypothetical protein